MTILERLEAYSELDPSTGCWVWKRANNGVGYGVVRYGGRKTYAHRVSYELLVGPIPPGLVIDHLCRNRACINPEHMEPVTRGENVMRGQTLAAANAAKTHCPRGHEYDYVHPRTGRRWCTTCSRQSVRDFRDRTKS